MSEIDDIFSSKGKIKFIKPTAPTLTPPEKKKKRVKDSKRKRESDPTDQITQTNTRPVPETIIDSAVTMPSFKRYRADNSTKVSGVKFSKISKEDDESKLTNSRRTGHRRKTEEGWNIYKEEELGLHDGGGDTPLCPFDCECCF